MRGIIQSRYHRRAAEHHLLRSECSNPNTHLLEGSKLRAERRRRVGAALAGAVEVLEGDGGSLDTRSLVRVRVASREGDRDRGAARKWSASHAEAPHRAHALVDRLAGIDVSGQRRDVGGLVGRAVAGDLDGLAIRTVHRTIAITGT